MPNKPEFASGYSPEDLRRVRATCLFVATQLGDLMEDVVVIGGLAPSLLIDQATLGPDIDRHVGTLDLDVGLALGLFRHDRYALVADRLRAAGFHPDKSSEGRMVRQRWTIVADEGYEVRLDFLIQPRDEGDRGGTMKNLEGDFAAVVTPGLNLAFQNKYRVRLEGTTLRGESAAREIWICGVGAFVVLKSIAFRNRGENKDAYDLYYVIRNYRGGPGAIAQELTPLLDDRNTQAALGFLRDDFLSENGVGAMRVARFLTGRVNRDVRADVVGYCKQLMDLLAGPS